MFAATSAFGNTEGRTFTYLQRNGGHLYQLGPADFVDRSPDYRKRTRQGAIFLPIRLCEGKKLA